MNEPINPYAPTVLTGDLGFVSTSLPKRSTRLTRLLSKFILLGSCVGAAVACYSIFTIVFSGPILFVSGLVLVIATRISKAIATSWIGMVSMLFCAAVTIAINAMHWSPTEAQFPIGTACVIFAFAIQLGWLELRSLDLKQLEAERLLTEQLGMEFPSAESDN